MCSEARLKEIIKNSKRDVVAEVELEYQRTIKEANRISNETYNIISSRLF